MKAKLMSIILVLSVVFAIQAPSVKAEELNSPDNYNLPTSQVSDSSVKASSTTQRVQGTIDGNYYCIGQDVVITGRVTGNVFCISSRVKLTGQIDGDLFVVSENLEIEGDVNGSVIALSNNLTISQSAKIRQDLIASFSNARIEGIIGRDAQLSGSDIRIDGQIDRNLNISSENILLYGNALIKGNLSYTSKNDIRIKDNAKIVGSTDKRTVPISPDSGAGLLASIIFFVIFLLSLLIVSILTVLLFPNFYEKTYGKADKSLSSTIILGLINLLLVPILALIVLLTIIGAPLGGLILTAWILSLMLSGPIFAYYVGKKLTKKATPLKTMFVGSLVVLVLYAIPVINILVGLTVAVVGSGALISLVKSSKLQLGK